MFTMGRKLQLLNECNRVLATSHRGSPTTRHWRQKTLHKMINQWVRLKMAPTTLRAVTSEHFQALVRLWEKKGLTPESRAKQISVLRFFYRLTDWGVRVPSNREMGIVLKPTGVDQLIAPPGEVLPRVHHPFTRTLLEFQYYFGLMKTESIRLDLCMAYQEASTTQTLLIDRSLAYNKTDRLIPIVSPEQLQAIKARRDLVEQQGVLADRYSEVALSQLMDIDLASVNINPKQNFRRYYAQQRFYNLLAEGSEAQARERLKTELGLTSLYHLRDYYV